MLTATRGDAKIVPSKPYATVLGRLLVAALLLTPLAAMLFPELNHRSGNAASGVTQGAAAARPVASGDCGRRLSEPELVPFVAKRSDR